MTRLVLPGDVMRWKEAELQVEVVRLARDAGWGVSQREQRERDEQLRSFGLPPDPLEGLIFHDTVAYRSEPGWPDLTMVRRRDRRLIFAELKREGQPLRPRQQAVLELLRCLETAFVDCASHGRSTDPKPQMPRCPDCLPLVQVFVWRPSDYLSGAIAEVLQ